MNVNGYIIADIPNFRYFSVLNEILNKKQWDFNKEGVLNKINKRFYTKKALKILLPLWDIFLLHLKEYIL